jgi:hypothetical protein
VKLHVFGAFEGVPECTTDGLTSLNSSSISYPPPVATSSELHGAVTVRVVSGATVKTSPESVLTCNSLSGPGGPCSP